MVKLKTAIIAAALSLTAGSAFAGGLDRVVDDPVVVGGVVAPLTWDGAYAGLSVGVAGVNGGSSENALGVFAGYRAALGDNVVVVGGEVSHVATDVTDVTALTAQVGYDLGSFLPYATAGIVKASGAVVGDGEIYGLGLDYRLNETWVVGAAITRTELDVVKSDDVALRAAFKF